MCAAAWRCGCSTGTRSMRSARRSSKKWCANTHESCYTRSRRSARSLRPRSCNRSAVVHAEVSNGNVPHAVRSQALDCLPRITLLGIRHDPASKIDRTFDRIEVANVVLHRLFGTTAQCCGLDQTVFTERSDVSAVLAGEATDFANREVERREQSHVEDRGIGALDRQRDGVVVGILVHEGKSVIVLAVEVEQSSGSIGILVGDFQVTGQRDAFGKHCIYVVGHSLAGIKMHGCATSHI